MSTRVIVGAAIVDSGLLLAQQRAWPADAEGRWELPGGRVDPGESEVDALARECMEELDVRVIVAGRVGPDVALPKNQVLRIYAARLTDPVRRPRAVEHLALRWLAAEQLSTVDWLPADRELLGDLRGLLGADQP